MTDTFDIAGYCRISVDTEQDRDNTSIENQRTILENYVKSRFPGSRLQLFEDRDRSGYTFEQRENYQTMRQGLMARQYDILLVKDFSRFARRNSRGLVELEDLRDAGVRIISVDDNVDYPNDDDWLKIQFQFLINEMPVTDASRKVKSVIKSRQEDAKWICAVPYGYEITNSKLMTFQVNPEASEVVRMIFDLYLQGWGYKKIANHLTALCIPTPRMVERARIEARGEACKLKVRPQWSIVTIQGILENDFYIGTLRQHKYTRKKIKGRDEKLDDSQHKVFENHHEAIIDPRTFATVAENRKNRSTTHYRGVKKYDTTYSGFLYCGDCGAPLFSMSRPSLKPAYTCGTYHRQGRKGCTSHHTRVDLLDRLLKSYILRVRDHSSAMMERLEADLKNEKATLQSEECLLARLESQLESAREELKATKRQKIRDLAKKPESAETIESIYAEMEEELEDQLAGLQNQIAMTADKRNTIIRVNRIARNALDIFDEILVKDKLEKRDLELILQRIVVYEDHLDIKLKSDIDALLSLGSLESRVPAEGLAPANFKSGTEDSLPPMAADAIACRMVQSSLHHEDKVFCVNIISSGDPLEIYTDKDGGVIFKKYSLMGGLGDFATQLCDTLHKTTGRIVVITDRDSCIAVAGTARKSLTDKRISRNLEQLMEGRQIYQHQKDQAPIPVCEDSDEFFIETVSPILSEGDVLGSVVFSGTKDNLASDEIEVKLAQTIAGFLGKHMES